MGRCREVLSGRTVDLRNSGAVSPAQARSHSSMAGGGGPKAPALAE